MSFAIGLDLAITLHGVDTASQAVKLGFFNVERMSDGCKGLRFAGGTQDAENFLAAGNAVGILAQKVGILRLIKTWVV